MLAAHANTERLLKPFLHIRQRTIRLFTQLAQQLGFNFWRYSARDSMTALRNPLHLLAAQSLPGYLLGPVIADRKQFRQLAQRPLPAIVGRQKLATKIIRIGLRHLSCREVQSYYSVHLMEKWSKEALRRPRHISAAVKRRVILNEAAWGPADDGNPLGASVG